MIFSRRKQHYSTGYLLMAVGVLLFFLTRHIHAQTLCDAIFPGPVQNSTITGSVTFNWMAYVSGASGNIVNTTDLRDNSGWWVDSCGTGNCSASGAPVPEGFYTGGYPGGSNVSTTWGQSIDLPPGNYRNLSHGGNGTIRLQPGVYTFSGRITSNTLARFAISAPGSVSIYVQGNVTFGYQSRVNETNTDRFLFVFSAGDILINNESIVHGVFYSNNFTLDYQAQLTGAATARNRLELVNESYVAYDSNAVANTNFQSFCDNTPSMPNLVAEWRLDELQWTGTAGDVLDNSGNNSHGRAVSRNGLPTTQVSNPALAGNPGTCRSGDFKGALDGFVQIDDPGTNSILDVSAYSVSAWIYARSYATDTLATIVSKDENFEFHINNTGHINWWWGGGSRDLTTAMVIPLNEWHHVTITNTVGAQIIYVDGVPAAVSSVTTGVTLNNDPVLIGVDLGFDSRRFDGLIDEVRIYDAPLTPLQVMDVMAETHPCTAENLVDHFAIDVGSGNASVCSPRTITITAVNSSNATVENYTGTVALTTSSGHGNWGIGSAKGNLLAGGADSGSASYTFEQAQLDKGSVNLDLSNTHAETITVTVTDSDAGVSSTSAPLTFSKNAFVVEATDVLDEDVIVGRDHQWQVSLMLQNEADSSTCGVATDYNAAAVKVWLTRQGGDPGGSAPRMINADNSVQLPLPDAEPAGSNMTFPFVNGVAQFSLATSDVGRYAFNFRDDSSGFSDQPISGGSSTLVARPFAFDIQVTGNPGAVDASGPVFVAAGQSFAARVRAVAWQAGDDVDADGIADGHNDNDPTNNADLSDNTSIPSFGQEPAPEKLLLSAALALPVGGNDPGLAGANPLTGFISGVADTNGLFFTDVGIIELAGVLEDGLYLDSPYSYRIAGKSGSVGRFVPADFVVQDSKLTPACNAGFIYMQQPAQVDFTVQARNLLDQPTLNYTGDFAKLAVAGLHFGALDAALPTPLSSRLDSTTAIAWTQGDGVVAGEVTLLRNAAPDGPYFQFTLGMNATDTDAVSVRSSSFDLDEDNDGVNDLVTLGQSTGYFGRLRLADAFGPETAPLPVIFVTERWNGLFWETNTDDSCTAIARTDIVYPGGAISNGANLSVALGGGTTTGSYANLTATDVQFINGDGGLTFLAPGAGNTGSFQVDVNLSSYSWLQFDWNGDANYAEPALPSATYTFGSYRGHDRVIYWREVLQ